MALDHHPLLSSTTHGGRHIPPLIYGAAEKSDPSPIIAALRAGYRAIDSACQPQYYHEDVVGEAIAVALAPVAQGGLGLRRSDLYVQTKFTTPAGHTPATAPYSHADPAGARVHKSLEMSLAKLNLDSVDALLLHGPMPTIEGTLETWTAMESFVGDRVGELGLCNVDIDQLQAVWTHAIIRPAIVQNRFGPQNGYDADVRRFCSERGIVYEAFWVLKANPGLLDSALVGWLADRTGQSREHVLFLLVLSLGGEDGSGVCVLNGTTSRERMESSLVALNLFGLVPEVVRRGFLEELDKSCRRTAGPPSAARG